MWSRLRNAVLWAQALDRYERKRFLEAIAKLNAIDGPRAHASEYLALIGSAHLALAGKEARWFLVRAINDSAPTRAEYRHYIDVYCQYYLAILDGNEGLATKSIETALRISAPATIRRWLPLS